MESKDILEQHGFTEPTRRQAREIRKLGIRLKDLFPVRSSGAAEKLSEDELGEAMDRSQDNLDRIMDALGVSDKLDDMAVTEANAVALELIRRLYGLHRGGADENDGGPEGNLAASGNGPKMIPAVTIAAPAALPDSQ